MNGLTFAMLCALPAAGKSTYAAAFLRDHPEYNLVCPDLIREQLTGDASDQSLDVHVWTVSVPHLIRLAAQRRQSVLFDSTAYRRKSRKGLIKLAKAEGYRIVAHVIRTPFEECVKRNAARARVVPLFVLEKMRDKWQDPSADEGIDEIVEIALDMASQASDTLSQ